MLNPRIRPTHAVQAAEPKAPVRARRPAPSPTRERRSARPLLLGLLLVLAGLVAWVMLPGEGPGLPDTWRQVTGSETPALALKAALREGGGAQGDLLRLEWPAHPYAESYVIQFETDDGFHLAPVPVLGNVFLYDLKSNALHLPPSFTWTVIAVMSDDSRAVTPPRRYPPVE